MGVLWPSTSVLDHFCVHPLGGTVSSTELLLGVGGEELLRYHLQLIEVLGVWVSGSIELRGFVTSYNITSHEGYRRVVTTKGIGMGNRPTGVNSGIGPGGSLMAIFNGGVGGIARVHCLVLGGPHNCMAAISSRRTGGAIVRLVRNIGRHICPINELSESSRKLLLFAGSNTLTGTLVRPSKGVAGVCHIAIHPTIGSSVLSGLQANIRVRNHGALPYSISIISRRSSEMILRFNVHRNEGHRVEGVYSSINLRITQLGQVTRKPIGLNVLPLNGFHSLAPHRVRGLRGLARGWFTYRVGLCRLWTWSSYRYLGRTFTRGKGYMGLYGS